MLQVLPGVERATHILDDPTFRSVLRRERKRCNRSNRSLLVLLARPADPHQAQAIGHDLVESLVAAAGETDLVGHWGSAVGLVSPELDSPPHATARWLRERVRREIKGRLNGAADAAVILEWHGYPAPLGGEPGGGGEPGWIDTADTLLDREEDRRRQRDDRVKRLMDLIGSLLLLVALAPLLLCVAVLIKIQSPGPVLFHQRRIGERGQPFGMLKFRTMHVHASDAIHQKYVSWFITSSDHAAAGERALFKLTNDPRVTRLGRFLRRTSLDELPQLWNVVRGEMSLVGPRPPLPYEVARYQPWHLRRVLEARPGITGLWQVTGRSRTTFDEMVRLDLRYARDHSWLTDVKILLATPRAVISGKGAC